jgi:nitrogen fixation protein NifX
MRTAGHIRVAIATNDLLQANAHFAEAKQIVFYDVSRDGHEFEECVQFRGGAAFKSGQTRGPGGGRGCAMADQSAGLSGEAMSERVEALRGCAMLFCKGLTDLHAVNVMNIGVYPVKLERAREIPEVIANVQRLIARPPLWLRRTMGISAPVTEATEDTAVAAE